MLRVLRACAQCSGVAFLESVDSLRGPIFGSARFLEFWLRAVGPPLCQLLHMHVA